MSKRICFLAQIGEMRCPVLDGEFDVDDCRNDLLWIHEALRDGRIVDAMARLERIIWPVRKLTNSKSVA